MQLPSDSDKRQKLVNYIQQAAEETLIIDAARGHIADMKKGVKEEFEITPKEFGRLVKAWIDENYPHEVFAEAEEFMHNYEILKGVSDE